MEKVISPIPGKVNPKIVGRSPAVIAEIAGITVPEDTSVNRWHGNKSWEKNSFFT